MTVSRDKIFCASIFGAVLAMLGQTPALANIETIRGEDNSLWLAAGATHLDYRENNDAGLNVDTEHGTLPTLSGGFSYLDHYSNIYLAMDADGSWGNLRYNGGLLNGTSYSGETSETIWSAHYRAGYAFAVGQSVMLIPLVHLGYRNWDRDLSATQSEVYHNWIVTGGLLAQYSPSLRMVFSLRGEVGETFAGGMKATAQGLPILKFDLGDELTYNVEAKAGYRISSRVEMFVRADYERLDYGRSQNVPIGGGFAMYEPNSRTDILTSQIGVAYRFQ
jgi:hypothetical protein